MQAGERESQWRIGKPEKNGKADEEMGKPMKNEKADEEWGKPMINEERES